MTPRCGACSSPADEGQVLAASDSWHFDAFAGAAGGGGCPALSSMVAIELLERQIGLATTNSAVMSDAGLACCYRSRCSFVGFAGSYLRETVGSVLLAG